MVSEFYIHPPEHLDAKDPHLTKVGGVIDALHFGGESFLLLDYKRKSIPTLKDVKDFLSPQLMVYARSLPRREDFPQPIELAKVASGYWSILDGKWKTIAQGQDSQVHKFHKQLGPPSKEDLSSLVGSFEKAFTHRCSEHLYSQGNFKPEVTKRCDLCDFSGVCRKSDGRFHESR